ncbi:hypothetical protein [Massilia sp. NR 4-1]|uniref:hypothetical protein n=1 Tax=Massilia sp. NR 4-1 TaxID=1678028 RepID=UPI00067B23FE|nr:hypothetical protein [Massilia sp. NR 4-1]AKU23029.1 hypothetical protein ACZ75_17765 [Massilia sp. NR 4-1]
MKQALTLLLAGAGALLSGCAGIDAASSTPQWDARFGDAVRAAMARQRIHPGGVNPEQVRGIDGAAALQAQEQYRKSFSAPAPQPSAFTIGVSGGK